MKVKAKNNEVFIASLRATYELPYYREKKYTLDNSREDLALAPVAVMLKWDVLIDEKDVNRIKYVKSDTVMMDCIHLPGDPLSFEFQVSETEKKVLWKCGRSYPTVRMWWQCRESFLREDGHWYIADYETRREYDTLDQALLAETDNLKSTGMVWMELTMEGELTSDEIIVRLQRMSDDLGIAMPKIVLKRKDHE